MGISNSFHSSGGSHSISSAGGLGKCQAHNERDYFARHLSADKISYIVGSEGIVDQVRDFINEEFKETFEAYNASQKRKDRRIADSPFDHFCKNKTMDVAVETIFQLGDMEYWSRWRTDTVIGKKKNGADIVAHEFPDEVAAVADEIYRQQAAALEKIYETDGDKILEKVERHYKECKDILLEAEQSNSEQFKKFMAIVKKKPKDRKPDIAALTPDELTDYSAFHEAYAGKTGIEEKHLIERIKEGRMHIKLLQLIGHHDEYSLHAHGILACWTEGHYERGLQARVAKSTVLNRYALEILQDKMREIAEREMAQHPEIFEETKLNAKGIGRGIDWTKEEVIRHNQQKLVAKVTALQEDIEKQVGILSELQGQTIDEKQAAEQARQQAEYHQELAENAQQLAAHQMRLAQEARDRLAKDEKKMKKLEADYKALSPIKSMKHYQYHVLTTEEKIQDLKGIAVAVAQTTKDQGGYEHHAREMVKVVFQNMKHFIQDVIARVEQTKFFELIRKVFHGEELDNGPKLQKSLFDVLEDAYDRSNDGDGTGDLEMDYFSDYADDFGDR